VCERDHKLTVKKLDVAQTKKTFLVFVCEEGTRGGHPGPLSALVRAGWVDVEECGAFFSSTILLAGCWWMVGEWVWYNFGAL
jgi:hypothetical protein